MRVFVDLTKAWPNTAAQLIQAVERYLLTNSIPPGNLTLVCTATQKPEVNTSLGAAAIIEADPISAIGAVAHALQATPPGEPSVVFSFNPVVLLAASRVTERNVAARKMIDLTSGAADDPQKSATLSSTSAVRVDQQLVHPVRKSWRWKELTGFDRDDAVQLLVETLKKHGPKYGGRLQLTSIKPLMAEDAPQLHGKGAVTGMSGFMTDLIREADAFVISEQDAARPLVKWISLREGARGSAAGPGHLSSASQAGHGYGGTVTSSIDRGGRLRQEPSTTQEVSREMERLLRIANQGPYSDARALTYQAIDDIWSSKDYTPLPLVVLVERGTDLARKMLEDANVQKFDKRGVTPKWSSQDEARSFANKQPWREIRSFLRDLILRSAVAIDDEGNRIVGSPSAALRKVKEMQKGWHETLDAEVTLGCIRLWLAEFKLDGLSDRHVDALSGMLHRRTYGGVIERTLQILDLLTGAERITYREGAFRLGPR